MELYIKIENGLIIGHPITIQNLKLSHFDFHPANNNYGYIRYHKFPPPIVEEPYLCVELSYYMANDECYETYKVRSMTQQEKNEKIASFADQKPYNSWIFDEENCMWKPPTPMPDGKYRWNEDTTSWQTDI